MRLPRPILPKTVLPELPKRKYKAVIAYDGTAYSGWQSQDNALAIQQIVEDVLTFFDDSGEAVKVFGSSRTDSGVHAKGFVAHFHMTKPIPPDRLVRAVNSRLPEDIRFLRASYASEDFHAQYSACGKEYRYQIYQGPIMPPHLVPYWAYSFKKLDLAAMRKAAKYFVGTHDFKSFAGTCERVMRNSVREVFSCEVKKAGPRYTIIVRGGGFLYKQVRSMVGFLISVGKGAERPEAVKELLEAATPRTARVETAPARGLFLWKVFYRRPKA